MKHETIIYESPALEVVEIETEQFFAASSDDFWGGGEDAGGIN